MKKAFSILSFAILILCFLLLCGCVGTAPQKDRETDEPAKQTETEAVSGSEPDTEAETEPETTAAATDTVTEKLTEATNAVTTAAATDPPVITEAKTEAVIPPVTTEAPPAGPSRPADTSPAEDPTLPLPERLVKSMTVEELVGQMFLARHPWSGAVSDIQSYRLGGYILFAKDFEYETPDSIRAKLSSYQSASKIPMLFAVDEEGGTVTRVSRHTAFRSSPFPSPRDIYNTGGITSIQQTEREKARLLRSIGLNVNVAPVCDITTDPDAFMYRRSLGQSPEVTADFVRVAVTVSSSEKVGAVLKHFPGYGNNTDTHVGIAIDNRSKSELMSRDLVPFQAGINSGADAILVSHTIITAIDSERPATLSAPVHELLRKEMGFSGVIVTDDLSMQAITKAYGAGEAAVMAVNAGNDLLCCTDYAVQYNAVLSAVKNGQIPLKTVKDSVLRILRWKEKLGLYQE